MKETVRFLIWIMLTLVVSFGFSYLIRSFLLPTLPYSSLAFAFQLQFFLMAWFAFSTPYLKMDYASTYFLPKTFEKGGKIYSYFGVHIFRKVLVLIGWEKFTRSMMGTLKTDVASLKTIEKSTRGSEFSHLAIFIVVLLMLPFLTPSLGQAKWLIITSILFHIYPIFIQRFNRPRYLRIMGRFEKRGE